MAETEKGTEVKAEEEIRQRIKSLLDRYANTKPGSQVGESIYDVDRKKAKLAANIAALNWVLGEYENFGKDSE